MQFDLALSGPATTNTVVAVAVDSCTPARAALAVADELAAAMEEIGAMCSALAVQLARRDEAIASIGLSLGATKAKPALAEFANSTNERAVETATNMAQVALRDLIVDLVIESGVAGPRLAPVITELTNEVMERFLADIKDGVSVPTALRQAVEVAQKSVTIDALTARRAQEVRARLVESLKGLVSSQQYEPGAELIRARGKIVWTLWTRVEDGFRERTLYYENARSLLRLIEAIEDAVAHQYGYVGVMRSGNQLTCDGYSRIPFEANKRWDLAHGMEVVARLKGYQLLLPDEVAAAIAMTLAE